MSYPKGAQQFELLDAAWLHFEKKTISDYKIGPLTFRLESANPDWSEKLGLAFRHLAIEPVAVPDLTVRLWDSAETGQALPKLDWNLINQNGYSGYTDGVCYFHYFYSIETLSAFHATQNVAYYMTRDWRALPWWVEASPLQVILHIWLRQHGLQLTHTAAVGDSRAAVLLCGKGGSGKSTTVLSCLAAGLHHVGEDYCVLETGAAPRVHSVYQSAKLERQTRQFFPGCDGFIHNIKAANTEKALVYYEELFPDRICNHLPVRAVLSLKVGQDQDPVLQSEDKTIALKNLMMSTLKQLPFYEARTVEILKKFVADVPTYQLILGRDLAANAALIKTFLSTEDP